MILLQSIVCSSRPAQIFYQIDKPVFGLSLWKRFVCLSHIDPLWCRINGRGRSCDSLATFFHRFPIFAFHGGRRGEHCGRRRRWRKGLIRPRPSTCLPATHDHWKGESPDEKGLGRDFLATRGELWIHFALCSLNTLLHGCEVRYWESMWRVVVVSK